MLDNCSLQLLFLNTNNSARLPAHCLCHCFTAHPLAQCGLAGWFCCLEFSDAVVIPPLGFSEQERGLLQHSLLPIQWCVLLALKRKERLRKPWTEAVAGGDRGAPGSIPLGINRACSSGARAGTKKRWLDFSHVCNTISRTMSSRLRAEMDEGGSWGTSLRVSLDFRLEFSWSSPLFQKRNPELHPYHTLVHKTIMGMF